MKRFRSHSLGVVALLLAPVALGAAGCSGGVDPQAHTAEHQGQLESVSLHVEGMT